MQAEAEETRIVLTEAGDWLLGRLASGPMGARNLRDRANNDGIPWRNVERAKARLGVVARRELGTSRRWVWALPTSEAEGPREEGPNA